MELIIVFIAGAIFGALVVYLVNRRAKAMTAAEVIQLSAEIWIDSAKPIAVEMLVPPWPVFTVSYGDSFGSGKPDSPCHCRRVPNCAARPVRSLWG